MDYRGGKGKWRAPMVRDEPEPGWEDRFLNALMETGNVTKSCRIAEVSSQTVYAHKASDPEFKTNFDEAMEVATDALEAEARRRALGERDADPTKVYSDTLMIFLLKAHRPEKFDPQRAVNALLRQIADNTAPKPRPE